METEKNSGSYNVSLVFFGLPDWKFAFYNAPVTKSKSFHDFSVQVSRNWEFNDVKGLGLVKKLKLEFFKTIDTKRKLLKNWVK